MNKLSDVLEKVVKTTSVKKKPTAVSGTKVGEVKSINVKKIEDMNE